jgi:hypothetical protein
MLKITLLLKIAKILMFQTRTKKKLAKALVKLREIVKVRPSFNINTIVHVKDNELSAAKLDQESVKSYKKEESKKSLRSITKEESKKSLRNTNEQDNNYTAVKDNGSESYRNLLLVNVSY